jgi:O-succinylbenzoate synthase
MQARAFVIEMPFLGDYETGSHAVSSRRGIIVSIADGTHTGWGEFVELPGYSLETTETALAALEMDPLTHSNPMAVAARRTAELDLRAKQESKTLTALLGAEPGPVAAGAVIGRFGDLLGTLAEAQRRIAEGYQKLKIKIGPGFDVVPALAIRSELPGVLIAADANGSYAVGEVPAELDEAELAYLEQPYAPSTDWKSCARLRSQLSTPICLDESITGPATLRSAIAAGACDLANLKAARHAGPAQAVELHHIAQSAGIGLVAGGLLETGIGRAAALALARLPGFTMPADLSASRRYWDRDLVTPPWELTNGTLVVPDAPGIGVTVDESALEAVTVASHLLPV